jgi:hypothetical protein
MEIEKLYLERKKKCYPLIVKTPVKNVINNKVYDLHFIPYLIYDDLLESFVYNKYLLETNKGNSINLKVYEYDKIIIKRTTNQNIKTCSKAIEIKDIKLDRILSY